MMAAGCDVKYLYQVIMMAGCDVKYVPVSGHHDDVSGHHTGQPCRESTQLLSEPQLYKLLEHSIKL